jgi:AcrR family transcriptional regulator
MAASEAGGHAGARGAGRTHRVARKSGRRPGNQDTRGAILLAAREAFAAKGFAGASIRGIAADAGVDAALVHHYFETKQQLFLATVAIPVPLGDLVQELVDGDLNALGERLVTRILGIWDSDAQPALIAAVRTALTQPDLSRSISEFLSLEVIGRIVGALDMPADEAHRRSGLVASQVVGMIVGRYVLRLPVLAEAEPAGLARTVGATVQHYLTGDLDPAPG